jgi:hypothetical protein
MVDIFNCDTCGQQTVFDRLNRETSAVFETIETLFFDRSDQLSVFDNRRRRIPVIRINTQYDHLVCFTLVILKSPQRQLWDSSSPAYSRF